AEAAGTVWGGKKVNLNPTKWDWVKNTGYKKPAARLMQTVDGEMAGGNRPPKPSMQQHPTHSDNNIGLKDRIRWTKSEFPTEKSFDGHYKKHRVEFGDITKEDYLHIGQNLLSKSINENILGYDTEMRRVRYDVENNIYVLGDNRSKRITTILKPKKGVNYYEQDWKREFDNH
ncbi:TPA: septum formation inhibitor Maf, partial [Neisseria meningitidis]